MGSHVTQSHRTLTSGRDNKYQPQPTTNGPYQITSTNKYGKSRETVTLVPSPGTHLKDGVDEWLSTKMVQ